jgi:hypothetical protein
VAVLEDVVVADAVLVVVVDVALAGAVVVGVTGDELVGSAAGPDDEPPPASSTTSTAATTIATPTVNPAQIRLRWRDVLVVAPPEGWRGAVAASPSGSA